MNLPPADSDDEYFSKHALHDAAEAGALDLVSALLSSQAAELQARAQEAIESHGVEPEAASAIANSHLRTLLSIRDEDQCTALHLALLHGHVHVSKALVAAGADVSDHLDEATCLHLVASNAALPVFVGSAVEAATLLLEAGLSPYSTDENGRTPVHWAAVADHAELCTCLLRAGGVERAQRATEVAAAAAAAAVAPLHHDGTVEEEELTLRPPSPVSVVPPHLAALPDDRGNTALHLAARYAAAAALEACLAAVQHPDDAGDSGAAHPAGMVAEPLVTANKWGETPLHCAALGGCLRCAELLLAAAPAARSATDKHGETPVQLARRRGHAAMAEAIHGGPLSAPDTPPWPLAMPGLTTRPALIVTSPDCLEHYTAPMPIRRGETDVPPENLKRLEVLVHPHLGALRASLFRACAWAEDCAPAAMTDVLRVHDWSYVRRIRAACLALDDAPLATSMLDPDTALSRASLRAALKAAGAVCHAVDAVVEGHAKRAFCAVRPPGHHAGPTGKVGNMNEPAGSHGFCLLNNVAIGAAYAISTHRHRGIRRVALLDFDVHHGNGTEACVANTAPSTSTHALHTPFSVGEQTFAHWRPWLDGDDRRSILFTSVQAYGRRARHAGPIYPGSGATCDTAEVASVAPRPFAAEAVALDETIVRADHPGPAPARAAVVPEDPDGEFGYVAGEVPRVDGPRVINVGIPGPGVRAALWRRAWRDKVLPAVVNFAPDLILVSAGFDAHRRDDLNYQFVGVREHDFAWLTDQIVQVANRVCGGRVVSVLEGGYAIQGGIASAFARSVVAHTHALAEPNLARWCEDLAAAERGEERRARVAKAERRAALRASRAAGAAAELAALQAPIAAQLTTALEATEIAAELQGAIVAASKEGGGGGVAPEDVIAGEGLSKEPAAVPEVDTGKAEGGNEGEAARPGKRRRGSAVDYVALNRELEQSQHAP